MDKLNPLFRAWRFVGTALSFLIFGIGGLIIPIILPLIYLLPGNDQCRRKRGRTLIHHAFRTYIRIMKGLGVLTYEIEQIENLNGAKLILANHPCLIDVVFLLALIPNSSCVVKGRLLKNPFTRGPVKAAGYILNEEGEDVIGAASRLFEEGQSLIIFPEGTRTTPGKDLDFKRGAAQIALRTGADITPVIITCTPTTLTKQDRWYHVPKKRVHLHLRVNETLPVSPYINSQAAAPIQARRLTSDLQGYFTKELSRHEQPEYRIETTHYRLS